MAMSRSSRDVVRASALRACCRRSAAVRRLWRGAASPSEAAIPGRGWGQGWKGWKGGRGNVPLALALLSFRSGRAGAAGRQQTEHKSSNH
eukprot:14503023-Alexandrium_andersonii.AAC.1